jgi:hypothetical protein
MISISDIDPGLVADDVNNEYGKENTVRQSRQIERSSSVGGGDRLDPNDDLRKNALRKSSAERKRKREKEIAYQNAKAKEESAY